MWIMSSLWKPELFVLLGFIWTAYIFVLLFKASHASSGSGRDDYSSSFSSSGSSTSDSSESYGTSDSSSDSCSDSGSDSGSDSCSDN
jgi:hypothetical protein